MIYIYIYIYIFGSHKDVYKFFYGLIGMRVMLMFNWMFDGINLYLFQRRNKEKIV
jgi:hypothetical protein